MKSRILGLLIFSIIAFQSMATDLYWVNGTGNWSDTTNHWSTVSGGAPGATLPQAGDNVIFDINSGIISLITTITVDTTINVDSIDFSGLINAFNMDAIVAYDHTIHGSIVGNNFGINFSGTWGEFQLDALSTGESILSGNIIWEQNFRVIGESISLLDDFDINQNDLFIDSSGIISNGNSLSLGSLFSTTQAIRNLNFENSTINVTEGIWDIDGTNVIANFTNSTINVENTLGIATFTGGSLVYSDLHSLSATTIQYYDDNSFDLFECPNSTTLEINNGDNLTTDSLVISGTCGNKFILKTINAGANGSITKTGYNIFQASNISVSNIDALGASNYNISLSELSNVSGWTLTPTSFYWIDDSGDWNDPNHWSLTSGGVVSGCLPDSTDSVFFDVNSFTIANQEVLVDDTAFFAFMDWSAITNAQFLRLDSSIYAYGDIILNTDLSIFKNDNSSSIRVKNSSQLTTNSAFISCDFALVMDDNTDSFELMDDFITPDSTNILLFNGKFNTLGNEVVTGSILSINNPFSGADQREINLGASEITLFREFNSLGDTVLNIIPGTSHLFIGDAIRTNALITEGNNFFNVTLDFPENTSPQQIAGNNTFNKLKITPGSHLYLKEGNTQTINDSLIMKGNCLDSIFISTLDSVNLTVSNINKTGGDISLECLNITGISNTGDQLTTYFSTDISDNLNWDFDPTPTVTASFTPVGAPFCYEDTVQFTNNSTAFSGDPNDIINYWYFNDGSTGYYVNPPTDSTFIDYEIDTLQHRFTGSGEFDVVLVTEYTNYCKSSDTVSVDIILPNLSLLASESDTILCPKTEVTFEAFSGVPNTEFEFFYNGVSQNTPSVNDTLFQLNPIMNGDTIGLMAYEQGCSSDTMPFYTYELFNEPTFSWSNNSTGNEICFNDTVSFTATSPDSINDFQFLLNNSSITGIQDSIATYSTFSLNDDDTISLVVIDTNVCRDTSSVTFTVNPLPTTSLTESTGGNVICENDLVTFSTTGASTYEFFVNNLSVQGPLTNNNWSLDTLTQNDTVSAVGYSALGCSFKAPEEYFYIVNPAPVNTLVSSDADNIICSDEQITFTSSGSSAYEFFINGVSTQGPSTNSTFEPVSLSNNDTVSVIGSTSGCQGNEPEIITTVNTAPTTALTNDDNGDNEICSGETVTFTASGATNYEFFVDGVSQGPSTTNNVFVTNSLTNGQAVTVEGESNSCVVSDINTFTVLTKPNVSLISNDVDNIICDGESITFTGSNASQYEFFVNNTSVQGPVNNSLLIDPTLNIGQNDVFVVGTANNGCTDSTNIIEVTVNAIPNITVSSSDTDNTICEGENVTFTSSGGDNYQFLINGTPQTSMSSTNIFSTSSLTNGQTLTVEGSLLGCQNTSNSIVTTVNPTPNIALSSSDANNIFCEDELVTYTASGATEYEFFVDGVSQGASSPANSINSSSFSVGTFPIEVIGTANDCSSSSSLTVTVNSLPTINLVSSDANNSICDGETVTYTASGGTLYEFFIDGLSQGAPSTSTSFSTSTLVDNEVVSVEGSSPSGCISDQTMAAIEVLPNPTVSLTSSDPNQEICVGENVTFTASGANEYEFFVNGNSQGTPSTNINLSLSNLSNGDNVQVEGFQNGCDNTSNSLTFQVFNYPIVNLVNNEDTVLCDDELTNLEANGADNYLFYINGNPSGAMSPATTFNSLLNNGDEVTVEGETNGCHSLSNGVSYTVFNYPTITSISSDPSLEICLNDTVDFTSSGAMTYALDINNFIIDTNSTGDFTITNIHDGDIVSITGYNGHCASTPFNFAFTVNEMNLNLGVTPSNLICEGENVTFTATGGDEYQFFLNSTSTGPLDVSNAYSSSSLNHHDEITFQAYNSTTGCIQFYNNYTIMNVMDSPTITPLSNIEFCEGDSVVLVSNIGYGNQWFLNGNPITDALDTFIVADSSGSYTLESTMGGNGDLWSIGQNASGVFANGLNFNSSTPLSAVTTLKFTETSSGFDFVLGIDENNELYAWGLNNSGQLGNGTFTSSNIPISAGGLTDIKTIATASNSSMATTLTGEVYVWGNNNVGQLATGNTSVINFPFLNTSLTDIDTIAAGRSHFILLKNDGTVLSVGDNSFGQLGNGTLVESTTAIQVSGLTDIATVGAGEYTSYAIDINGELFVWGNNSNGQLGLGDFNNRLVPTSSTMENVVSVQGGANHTVFLNNNNEVYTSGGNAYGQLGLNNQNNTNIPKKVDMMGIDMISTGQYSTLLKRTDHSVFGFGSNTENQISSVTDTVVLTPTHIAELEGVSFIEASRISSHFIYNEQNTCVSSPVVTDFLPAPDVAVLANGDTLTASQNAVSYQWYFNGNIITNATNQAIVATSSGNYSVEVTYNNGCTSISENHYHSVTSLSDFTSNFYKVYPNPAKEYFTIEIFNGKGTFNIVLTDNLGKVVYSNEFNSSNTLIETSSLDNGVYYLKIGSNSFEKVEKIVISH